MYVFMTEMKQWCNGSKFWDLQIIERLSNGVKCACVKCKQDSRIWRLLLSVAVMRQFYSQQRITRHHWILHLVFYIQDGIWLSSQFYWGFRLCPEHTRLCVTWLFYSSGNVMCIWSTEFTTVILISLVVKKNLNGGLCRVVGAHWTL